jgi:hypothetical protein
VGGEGFELWGAERRHNSIIYVVELLPVAHTLNLITPCSNSLTAYPCCRFASVHALAL